MSAIIEELGTRPLAPAAAAATETAPPAVERHVYCLPARADRDELAGAMLAQLLREQGFATENASGHLAVSEMIRLVERANTDAVVISVVTPTTAAHARQLCQRVRTELPRLKIVIGLWNAVEELAESTQRLREAGADAVVTTLADALAQVAQLVPEFPDEMLAAPTPADEEQRLVALDTLHLPNTASPSLDRLAAKLARVFELSLAFVAVVERHRQFFLGQSGLPDALASARQTQRNISFSGHVIARNETLAIEDLARDRRFANNPFRREYGLRFAVGVPLHAPDGQPIGALCLMDTKPRQFTASEARLLEEYAAEAEEELAHNSQLEPR